MKRHPLFLSRVGLRSLDPPVYYYFIIIIVLGISIIIDHLHLLLVVRRQS